MKYILAKEIPTVNTNLSIKHLSKIMKKTLFLGTKEVYLL